jgi:hypothetical protein
VTYERSQRDRTEFLAGQQVVAADTRAQIDRAVITPLMLEQCVQAPPSWRIGRMRFERNADPIRRWHRWGCSDGAYGVCNYVTPLGALLAQRCWRRENLTGRIPPQA